MRIKMTIQIHIKQKRTFDVTTYLELLAANKHETKFNASHVMSMKFYYTKALHVYGK